VAPQLQGAFPWILSGHAHSFGCGFSGGFVGLGRPIKVTLPGKAPAAALEACACLLF
jgi:hypothetical protein